MRNTSNKCVPHESFGTRRARTQDYLFFWSSWLNIGRIQNAPLVVFCVLCCGCRMREFFGDLAFLVGPCGDREQGTTGLLGMTGPASAFGREFGFRSFRTDNPHETKQRQKHASLTGCHRNVSSSCPLTWQIPAIWHSVQFSSVAESV